MDALHVSTEIVRPCPYLVFILAPRDWANISASIRLCDWVDAPLVPVEVVQGAKSFTAATIRNVTNMGLGMSLFVLPRGKIT